MSMEAGADASPFTFDKARINDELMAMRAGAAADFVAHEDTQLGQMRAFNPALEMAHRLLVAEADGDLLTERRTSMGALLAYNVLQTSAKRGLIKVKDVFTIGYINGTIGRPGMVKEHVQEDFPEDQHPWLHDMFDRLQNEPAQQAARAIIALHGKQANEGRADRDISLEPDRSAKEEARKPRGGIQGTGLTAAQLAGGPTFPGAATLIGGGGIQHQLMETRPSRHHAHRQRR